MALKTTVDGIEYPREVEPPDGLPPGFKCIEQIYHTGTCKGQVYARYRSPDGKNGILSVKACIKMDADAKGLDGDEVAAEWAETKKRKLEEKKALRESKNDQALQRFVEVFGQIDGNMLQNWVGWSAKVKLVPSGQLHTTYYGPDKASHGTIKSAQTFLGHRLLEGEDLAKEHADAAAKAAGAGGNPAREALREQLESEGIKYTDKGHSLTMTEAGLVPDEPPVQDASRRPEKRMREAIGPACSADYREVPSLAAVGADALSDRGWPAIAAEVEELRTLLAARGFSDGIGLLAVVRGQGEELGAAEAICGNYFALPSDHNGRPCFKRLARVPGSTGIICRELYISWSKPQARWKIGALDDGKAGLAFLAADISTPTESVSGEGEPPQWSVLTGETQAKAT